MKNSQRTLCLAAAAGAVCGMRSMTPAAFLARRLQRRSRSATVSNILTSPIASKVLGAFAAGEMIADKTPVVPARIEIPALIGRIGMAKLCAVAIAEQRKEGIILPAAISAFAAIAGTYASYHARRIMTHDAGITDAIVAVAEDCAVIYSSIAIANAVMSD
jgi:uncharacterized membrane protein